MRVEKNHPFSSSVNLCKLMLILSLLSAHLQSCRGIAQCCLACVLTRHIGPDRGCKKCFLEFEDVVESFSFPVDVMEIW